MAKSGLYIIENGKKYIFREARKGWDLETRASLKLKIKGGVSFKGFNLKSWNLKKVEKLREDNNNE